MTRDYRSVKLHNPYALGSSEAQWVKSQQEKGVPKLEIIANAIKLGFYGRDEELVTLIVEYQLGERPKRDIEHLFKPGQPSEFVYIGKVSEGYLCEARGDADSTFKVLVKAPSVSEEKIRTAIAARQDEFLFFAYKNAHEGNPFGYSFEGSSETALAGISYSDIAPSLE